MRDVRPSGKLCSRFPDRCVIVQKQQALRADAKAQAMSGATWRILIHGSIRIVRDVSRPHFGFPLAAQVESIDSDGMSRDVSETVHSVHLCGLSPPSTAEE